MNDASLPSRDALATEYFERLLFPPYPVQEEALLAWFTSTQGVLVGAPTGTGKTLIAEAAVYEALRTGSRMYYTTPLIALTDQKLTELRESAVRWGFNASDVGLITGSRRVNPEAPVLVVVAEILLNRLLNASAFDFSNVTSVVMDEFHSFNDPERGIVWELSLGLLPAHVRTMLLSATVGNAVEFTGWLHRAHGRNLQLVQGTERRVPLQFRWVGDELIGDWLEKMAEGDAVARRTPALVFCFNREACWTLAELLRGKHLVDSQQQKQLAQRLEDADLSTGAGPKLKSILQRGIGIHHAGILPKYRRVVEALFQEKLLSVCVCTETLAAGINLPARSVVLPELLKGPKGKKKLVDPSSAHQIFGRAGRPQFDNEGFVFAIAHEDDVKILRWKEKYDQIPEDTPDPKLRAAKKQLKKKMPTRRAGEPYWSEAQFEQLRVAAAAKLGSRGQIPWRLLAYLILQQPDVEPLRQLVGKRLLPPAELNFAQRELNRMLVTLWTAGYVELEPKPRPAAAKGPTTQAAETNKSPFASLMSSARPASLPAASAQAGSSSGVTSQDGSADDDDDDGSTPTSTQPMGEDETMRGYELVDYRPDRAKPTARLQELLQLRSIHPLYGLFAGEWLAMADDDERLQVLESLLEMTPTVARDVRPPPPDEVPPGPLATERLHPLLLQLGLVTAEELTGKFEEDESAEGSSGDREGAGGNDRRRRDPRDRFPPRPLTLAEKLLRLFQSQFPRVNDVRITPVAVASEVLQFGDFNKYILARKLQKQEGVLFRHLLRLIMLLDEVANIPPMESTPENWEDRLDAIADRLIEICNAVDPQSTSEALDQAGNDDLIKSARRTPG
jgi:superfamily II DNA/RNA helicase